MRTSKFFLWCAIAVNVILIVAALLTASNHASFDERFGIWKMPPKKTHWHYRPCNAIQQHCDIG